MDVSKPKALKALEALMELGSFSQYEVWKKAGTSFATAHKLVHYLEEKGVVAKASKKYVVSTWPGLLSVFAVHRTFPKPVASLSLSMNFKDALRYFDREGFIRCLTTAWSSYDDYVRDPELHFYASDADAVSRGLAELSQMPKGTTLVNIYMQDLAVTPVKGSGYLLTGLFRTLLDLYSSKYAYAAERWIKKKASK